MTAGNTTAREPLPNYLDTIDNRIPPMWITQTKEAIDKVAKLYAAVLTKTDRLNKLLTTPPKAILFKCEFTATTADSDAEKIENLATQTAIDAALRACTTVCHEELIKGAKRELEKLKRKKAEPIDALINKITVVYCNSYNQSRSSAPTTSDQAHIAITTDAFIALAQTTDQAINTERQQCALSIQHVHTKIKNLHERLSLEKAEKDFTRAEILAAKEAATAEMDIEINSGATDTNVRLLVKENIDTMIGSIKNRVANIEKKSKNRGASHLTMTGQPQSKHKHKQKDKGKPERNVKKPEPNISGTKKEKKISERKKAAKKHSRIQK